MSDKAEAAQKWAEAKAALEAADTAFEAAKLAYSKAEDAEFHAWQALEALAGRTSLPPPKDDMFVTLPPQAPNAIFGEGIAARVFDPGNRIFGAAGQMLKQEPQRQGPPNPKLIG